MPLPTVNWYVKRSLFSLFSNRLRVVLMLMDVIQFVSMGLFISYELKDKAVKDNLFFWEEKAIDAYIAIAGLPNLLAVFGEEIMKNPSLDAYFSKFKAYKKWKDYKLKTALNYNPEADKNRFILGWIDLTPFANLMSQIADFFADLKNLSIQVFTQLWNLIQTAQMDPFKAVDYILQNFVFRDFEPEDICGPIEWVFRLNPFIYMDWAVIKSQIILLSVYKHIEAKLALGEVACAGLPRSIIKKFEEGEPLTEDEIAIVHDTLGYVPAYLAHDKIYCYYQDKFLDLDYIKEDGTFEIKIPIEYLNLPVKLKLSCLEKEIIAQPLDEIYFYVGVYEEEKHNLETVVHEEEEHKLRVDLYKELTTKLTVKIA